MPPMLVATPLLGNASRTALDVPMQDATALPPVPACAGRQGAAGGSPEGVLASWGGPAALTHEKMKL